MRQPFDPEVARRRALNAQIFKDTTAIIRRGWYTAPSGRRVDLDMEAMDKGSVCYKKEIPLASAPVRANSFIQVEPDDCLVVAQDLVSMGYRPVLLNFASAGHPGGGVERGARAQEETICRRSTLTRSIYSFDEGYAARYGYPHHEGNNYPLDNLDFSAIYSPAVTVFREGPECTLMEEPFNVAVITCAALNLGGRYPLKLTPEGHMPERAVAITRNKVRTILRIGLLHGHDAFVLGAFGCGAFHNPPEEMAAIFHEVLEEPEFKNRIRQVTFAILEDHNSRNANFRAFSREFDGGKGDA